MENEPEEGNTRGRQLNANNCAVMCCRNYNKKHFTHLESSPLIATRKVGEFWWTSCRVDVAWLWNMRMKVNTGLMVRNFLTFKLLLPTMLYKTLWVIKCKTTKKKKTVFGIYVARHSNGTNRGALECSIQCNITYTDLLRSCHCCFHTSSRSFALSCSVSSFLKDLDWFNACVFSHRCTVWVKTWQNVFGRSRLRNRCILSFLCSKDVNNNFKVIIAKTNFKPNTFCLKAAVMSLTWIKSL